MIKNIIYSFFFLFLITLPLDGLCVTMPTSNTSKIFSTLQNELVDLHTTLPLNQNQFTPQEEAVIVFAKGATTRELFNLNFHDLPKEFLIKAIANGGRIATGFLTDPSGVVKTEILTLGQKQLIEFLRKGKVQIGNGRISLSYINTKNERSKEFLYYTIIFCGQKNDTSITFYSEKPLPPPLSRPSYSVQSTEWRQHQFNKDKIEPFTITFNGRLKENQFGGFSFLKKPQLKIEFFEKMPSYTKEEKQGNNFLNYLQGLFKGIGDFFASSWSALAGSIFFNSNTKKSVVDLSSLETPTVEIEKEEEHKETIIKKEEEEKKTEVVSPLNQKVEINTALGEDLERLVGIGPTYAERIIAARPFCTLDDLIRVRGIGEATLQKIKDQGLAYVVYRKGCVPHQEEEKTEEKIVEDDKKETEEGFDRDALLKELKEIEKELALLRQMAEERAAANKNQKIEINTASLEDLQKIVRVGPVMAQRIIDARPFCTLDDLLKVAGIGSATIAAIKEQDLAYVNPPDSCFDDDGKVIEDRDEKPDGGRGGGDQKKEDDEDDKEEKITAVEINTAPQHHLELIVGIGPVMAQRIINDRPFCTLDDLLEVTGIGDATLQKIKDQGLAYVDPPDSCDNGGDNKDDDSGNGEEDNDGNGNGDDDDDGNGNDSDNDRDGDGDDDGSDDRKREIIVLKAETTYFANNTKPMINPENTPLQTFSSVITHSMQTKYETNLLPEDMGLEEDSKEKDVAVSGAETVWKAGTEEPHKIDTILSVLQRILTIVVSGQGNLKEKKLTPFNGYD